MWVQPGMGELLLFGIFSKKFCNLRYLYYTRVYKNIESILRNQFSILKKFNPNMKQDKPYFFKELDSDDFQAISNIVFDIDTYVSIGFDGDWQIIDHENNPLGPLKIHCAEGVLIIRVESKMIDSLAFGIKTHMEHVLFRWEILLNERHELFSLVTVENSFEHIRFSRVNYDGKVWTPYIITKNEDPTSFETSQLKLKKIRKNS